MKAIRCPECKRNWLNPKPSKVAHRSERRLASTGSADTAALLWLQNRPYTGADELRTWLANHPDADAVECRCQCGNAFEIPRATAEAAILTG